jgi:tetratricopeptide (TPR) repeat protein
MGGATIRWLNAPKILDEGRVEPKVHLNMSTEESVLNDLQKALESVNFDGARTILEGLNWTLPYAPGDLASLRTMSIAVEVADYFGMYDVAREVLKTAGPECEKVVRDLYSGTGKPPAGRAEIELLKRQVWTAMHWGFSYYRTDQLQQAYSIFDLCREVVDRFLVPNDDPCFGTLARISYAMGLVHRESYDHVAARVQFTESVKLSWQHLENKLGLPSGEYAGAKAITDFHVAKCLALGLGWICYTEGLPYLARPFIAAARVLLAGTKDRIIKSYLDVVYASSQRAAFGDVTKDLDEAEKILLRAHGVFTGEKHHSYQMRAADELAMVYVQYGHLEEAEKRVQEVKTLASSPLNHRWLCHAYIIESRIWRSRAEKEKRDAAIRRTEQISTDPQVRARNADAIDGLVARMERVARSHAEKALIASNNAIQQADALESRAGKFNKIDALITRGEALLLLEKPKDAKIDFERVLKEASINEKVRSVCELHLAKTCIFEGDAGGAQRHYERWKTLKDKVENAWIKRFAAEIEKEVAALKDFVISWDTKSIDTKEVVARFHEFLARWATDKSATHSAESAAALLEIAKNTLRNWKDEPEKIKRAKRQTKKK